jgi:hypothetical protein
VDGVDGAG